MDFLEVYTGFHFFCLKVYSNFDRFGRFQTFCSVWCDLRAFERSLQISGIIVILVQKVNFRPPLWILWRCTEVFMAIFSNYARITTVLVDFRHFAQLCVTSGPFKYRSKLAELWYLLLKKVYFKPPSSILWRCRVDFIKPLSNFV